MTGWVRREYGGIGVTQYRPGPHLAAVQEPYQGKVLLCIDISGSMAERAGLRTRLEEAKRGARQFVEEAIVAHYKVGLVLWNHTMAVHVPLSADSAKLETVLRAARPTGGTDIVPTLELGVRELGHLTGDRVMAIFGDGDLGPREAAVRAAREVARHGIRIVTRGLGPASARDLAEIATADGAADAIESGDIASGIAAMVKAVTIRR
jgi:Mg-chelatase subunit ChlD